MKYCQDHETPKACAHAAVNRGNNYEEGTSGTGPDALPPRDFFFQNYRRLPIYSTNTQELLL